MHNKLRARRRRCAVERQRRRQRRRRRCGVGQRHNANDGNVTQTTVMSGMVNVLAASDWALVDVGYGGYGLTAGGKVVQTKEDDRSVIESLKA